MAVTKNTDGTTTTTTTNADGSVTAVITFDGSGIVYSTKTTAADGSGYTETLYPNGTPTGGKGGGTVTVKNNPDGSVSTTDSLYPGLTNVTSPTGQKSVVDASGNPLSAAQLNAANNAQNGALGKGGILGLGSSVADVAGTTGKALLGAATHNPLDTFGIASVAKSLKNDLLPPPPPVDASASNAGKAASQSLVDQFNNAYKNFQPVTAPVAQAAQLSAQRDAVAGQLGPQTYVQAGQVSNVPQVQAPNVGQAQQVQAAQVGNYLQAAGYAVQAGTATAQQITALERVQPGIVGQIKQASAAQVGTLIKGVAQQASATTLDPTAQAQFRDNQTTLIGYLTGAIDGSAPSVAKLQLDDATQRNEANQLGIAAAASRGGNSALAMRTAANNVAMINQKAAADAALLRAQEVATARGQYGDVANSARNTDVSIAGQNASLLTGVSQSNAQLGTQASLANASNDLSKQQTNAGLLTSVSQSNAKNLLDAQSLQANLNQQASTANAANFLSAAQTNATLGTQASVANANNVTAANTATANNYTQASVANANNSLAAQLAQAKLNQDASTSNAANATSLQQLQATLLYNASHDNAGNALSAAQTNANLQTQASTSNAANATTLNTTQGQLDTQASINNANNATTLNTTQGQLSNAANLANAGNAVTTAGQNITAQQNAAGNTLTAQGQVNAVNANVLDNQTGVQKQQMDANGKVAAAGIGGGGALLAALSDRRAKTAVKDGRGSAQDLMDALSAKSFRYKNSANGAGEKTGVMAQDVEKTKAGRGFVVNTPQGKRLDPSQGFGSVLAMLATLNERVKKVEAHKPTAEDLHNYFLRPKKTEARA